MNFLKFGHKTDLAILYFLDYSKVSVYISFLHVVWGDKSAPRSRELTSRVTVMKTVHGAAKCYNGCFNFAR